MESALRLLVPPFIQGRAAVGLLVMRTIVGLAFAFHGYPKMQHPASWMTLAMGPRALAPGWLQAIVALVEFFGGIALIAGLLTPLATALIFCDMVVALFAVDLPSGATFVGGRRSYELTLVYLVFMLGFFLAGPGTISLDYRLSRAFRSRRPERDLRRASRP